MATLPGLKLDLVKAKTVAVADAPAAAVAPNADALGISVSTDGDLQSSGHTEFGRTKGAPLSIEALNQKAFPPPQTKYSDNEYLEKLFDAAEKALAKQSKLDAQSIAMQLIATTATTSVAAMPQEAIELFFKCVELGFAVHEVETQKEKPSRRKTKVEEADSEIDHDMVSLLGL